MLPNGDLRAPKSPEYANENVRLQTFENWPREHHMLPKDLAKAGFFKKGPGDCTRCFHCGGGLRDWKPQDDVWVEHARWFPMCTFLHLTQGDDFVRIVREMVAKKEPIYINDVLNRIQDERNVHSMDIKAKL